MSKQEMMTMYERWSAAHKYILGFVHEGTLYYIVLTFGELCRFAKLDHASSSRGGFAKLRIRLTAADRAELAAVAIQLGDASMLRNDLAHNKGENFERIITELLTATTWVKDNKPFNECGDIRIGDEEIQIKLDNAELTNEKILGKLAA